MKEPIESGAGKNHLLAIAIDQYQNGKINALSNCVSDARRVVEILKYKFGYDNVIELYDEMASETKVIQAFRDLMSGHIVSQDDNLIVYYAGHGFFDPRLERGGWILHDTKVITEPERYYTNYFDFDSLLKTVGAIKNLHTFIIADSCYSGSIYGEKTRRIMGDKEYIKTRWALTSGRNEPVLDGAPNSSSPFAQVLCDCLEKVHESIWVSELSSHVMRQMAAMKVPHKPRFDSLKIRDHDAAGLFCLYRRHSEFELWEAIKTTPEIPLIEKYLRNYPSGTYIEEVSTLYEQCECSLELDRLIAEGWKLPPDDYLSKIASFVETYLNVAKEADLKKANEEYQRIEKKRFDEEDKKTWDKARLEKIGSGFFEYLASFGRKGGKYVKEAKAALAAIHTKKDAPPLTDTFIIKPSEKPVHYEDAGIASELATIYIPDLSHESTTAPEVATGGSRTMDKSDTSTPAPPTFDEVYNTSESVWAVVTKGKWGFVDNEGFLLTELKYDRLYDFSEGISLTQIGSKKGFVDKTGREIRPNIYDEAYSFSNSFAIVGNRGKKGYINRFGAAITAPDKYEEALDFSEGLAAVRRNNKMGFINDEGKEIIPLTFDAAWPFSEGLAVVEKDGLKGYIDKNGKIAIPLNYDEALSFQEGLAVVVKGPVGYINNAGEVIIPLQYEYGRCFSEGLAAVKLDGKFGFINPDNTTAIDFQFDDAESFESGMAKVQIDKKVFFIDTYGEKVDKPVDLAELQTLKVFAGGKKVEKTRPESEEETPWTEEAKNETGKLTIFPANKKKRI